MGIGLNISYCIIYCIDFRMIICLDVFPTGHTSWFVGYIYIYTQQVHYTLQYIQCYCVCLSKMGLSENGA